MKFCESIGVWPEKLGTGTDPSQIEATLETEPDGLLFCCAGNCEYDSNTELFVRWLREVGQVCCPGNTCDALSTCCGGYCIARSCPCNPL